MYKRKPIFSIIICLYKINNRFFEDLRKYSDLKYKEFEIVLVTEKNVDLPNLKNLKLPISIVKAKKTPISLGEKRDIGLVNSNGDFCAFIDDDAYPDKNWLTHAFKLFNKNSLIGALGGPNITPIEDNFWAKIGGYIYESYFTSGGAQYRFIPKEGREVSELQGVNLIIRKDVLKRIGGFDSRLNSGDDSKVCSSIRKSGYKVVYDPNVKVYHHRRAFPKEHLRQVRNMGTHRGFFLKKYPQTLAPIYFLPLLMIILLVLGFIGSLFSREILLLYLSSLILAYVVVFLSVVKRVDVKSSFFVTLGVFLTHLVYGVFFVKGIFIQRIER